MAWDLSTIFSLTNARAKAVAMVDTNGDQITTLAGTPPANAALTSVAASVTSVTLLAANANRRKFIIINDGTKNLFVAFAATATSAAYSVLLPGGQAYESEMNDYTGVISGIWATANGNARITEITV